MVASAEDRRSEPPVKLYRVMRIDPADGQPMIGTRRNMLGVRPTDPASTDPNRRFDVDAVNGTDVIQPGTTQGLSVSTSADRMVAGRNEAVWEIEDTDLVPVFVPVPAGPPHHILEPSRPVTLNMYQAALAGTKGLWVRVT